MDLLIYNINRIIREKGYKKYVIAERAGISPKMFSAMLHKRKIIKAEDIPKISNALGVMPNDLFSPPFNNILSQNL